jgi:hypothetical protein
MIDGASFKAIYLVCTMESIRPGLYDVYAIVCHTHTSSSVSVSALWYYPRAAVVPWQRR